MCITDYFRVCVYILDEVVLCAFNESTVSMLVSTQKETCG